MTKLLKDFGTLLKQNIKGLFVFIGFIIIILVVLYSFASYETTNSEFCDSCHYMDPYVRHWQASKHSGVDCVACHEYSGGDLILSSIKYATETYNTRPQARVMNENCLAADCHDEESLDKGLKYKENIFFQHSTHLNKVLRSGKLHCTSCHNQMSQQDDESLTHMKVNEQTCFVCHFKDAGEGEAITGCYSCHGNPKTAVEHDGFMFNHEPYLELGVECKQCHIKIVQGDASVPEGKCYSCHVERFRKDYTKAELHDIHVTNAGINCQKCHDLIKHGNYKMVGALEIQCENCHLRQHNKPKQLYMGIGSSDKLHDMPSAMFQAQVSCTGCHTHITAEGEVMAHQEKKEASRKSCVTCHGENYDLMFDNWKSGEKLAMKDYKTYMKKSYADFKTIGGSKKQRRLVQSEYTKMKEDFNLVSEGHMVHNIKYSTHILNHAADKFENAMKKINKSYQTPFRGDALSPEKNCQVFCHGNAFFPEVVKYDDTELPHELHAADMELACSSCHSLTEHGKTKINDSVCTECH